MANVIESENENGESGVKAYLKRVRSSREWRQHRAKINGGSWHGAKSAISASRIAAQNVRIAARRGISISGNLRRQQWQQSGEKAWQRRKRKYRKA